LTCDGFTPNTDQLKSKWPGLRRDDKRKAAAIAMAASESEALAARVLPAHIDTAMLQGQPATTQAF